MKPLPWIGGRPSERHDELRPAQCMSCGRIVRLNPSVALVLVPTCTCKLGRAGGLNWRVQLGAGEPDQLICDAYPQTFGHRDRLTVAAAKPGRGVRLAEALAILTFRGNRGEG